MNRIQQQTLRSKRLRLACLAVCVLLLMTGCSRFIPVPAENLVRPPRLGGTNALLEAAFEKHVQQGEYVLRYPASGVNKTAYVRYDCDGDGLDEALVFYSLRSEEMVVRICMMDFDGTDWTAADDLVGDGPDVYSVDFLDLDNNGISEILVGWTSLDAKSNKHLTVYGTEAGAFAYHAVGMESYTELYSVDMDADGQTELLLTLITSGADKYSVECKLFKFLDSGGGSSLELRGQTELYSETVSFDGFQSEKQDGVVRVYIDENAGSTHLTEIVYWDAQSTNLARAMTLDPTTLASSPVARSLPIKCRDVDGDGTIEVPSTAVLAESRVLAVEPDAEDEPVYVVTWSRFGAEGFTPVTTYVENTAGGYRFTFEEQESELFRITIDPEHGLMRFDEARPEGETLFTIYDSAADAMPPGTRTLTSDEERVWSYQITPVGLRNAIDRTYLSDRFSLIETEERVS